MVGWKKAASVIHQCCRCYCLRDPLNQPGECKSCRALLNISHSTTRLLAFCEASDDASPVLTFNVNVAKGQQAGEGRALCN
jgi:hypothetical protein